MKTYHRLFLFIFVVLLASCRISGQVTRDGEGLADQKLILEGEGISVEVYTDQDGYYSFKDIESGYYRVRLDGQGSLSQPVFKVTNQSNVSGINFNIATPTVRETTKGTVLGSIDSNGTYVWKGIPFATAPLGDLRWRHALPGSRWEGEFLALSHSSSCTQLGHLQLDIPITEIGKVVGSEDCLYLNVWSPAFESLPAEPRPVMFWIHGGGNTAGESAIFDGKVLADKYGVIVITVNYRLGVFGWFSHPALQGGDSVLAGSPNFATTDLILALQWVQDNIEQFGGDKNRVMIFGESSGAVNVASLLVSPLASGLFQRAAMQSGGFPYQTKTESENYFESGGGEHSSAELINRLLIADGLAENREAAILTQDRMTLTELETYLRSKTASDLLVHFDGSNFGMYGWQDFIGDGVVIPEVDPYLLFETGQYNQVPIIAGTNRDEIKLFMAFDPAFTVAGLPFIIKDKNYYELAARYRSDFWKAGAVDEFAYRATVNQPGEIFTYRFDWDEEPKILWNELSEMIGASHFFEVPFVFGTPNKFPVSLASPLLFTKSSAAGRQQLGNSVSSYWAAFAYTGDPGFGYGQSEDQQWRPWVNGHSSEKTLILDTPADAGIRMAVESLFLDDLQLQLQAEEGFGNQAQKCSTYLSTYGADTWVAANCP
ncbi:MAG: carboxylesterase family protein [Pseudomonadales bacterium]|nr:carboxylesterase family protein [Pseudomonadales bacterium]